MNELILSLYIFTLTVILIFSSHGFIMIYYRNKFRNSSHSKAETNADLPAVTIQLPLYNEMYVAERLIDSVCCIEYERSKLEIQVLDDSTDSTTEIVNEIVEEKRKEGFNIKHIHRTNRKGYKAGALKEGLLTARGEFIAIFDADFVPRPDFLKTTMGYFSDNRVGMVQTRWEHINEDYSLLTRIQALALNGHFVIEQTVRNKAGFFINFNGTGGIWKKKCIEDAGNWQDDTLTEDLDLSYRAQLKGWKFIFLRDLTTPAELPAEINALKAQQFRWTKGAIETAKKLLPMVWNSDLNLKMKLQSTFHLTNNIVFPFILVAGILNVPLIFIKNSGPYDTVFNYMSVFVLAFISSFLFYLNAQRDVYLDWRKKITLFPIFMAGSMGLAVNNTRAVMEGLLSRKSEFVRTPKYKIDNQNKSYIKNKYFQNTKFDASAFVELILAVYCFIGVAASVYFFEIAALPFQLMFFVGFGVVSYLSFRQNILKKQGLKT
ncbi:MAG: glycosyltransferase [Melioribacteraceae bacterium]|nr:glycosyltransferase [Melioribacteraceae bacterium]